MLEHIQRLSHGFATLPVWEGVGEVFQKFPEIVNDRSILDLPLSSENSVNSGPWKVALRTLEAAGWIFEGPESIYQTRDIFESMSPLRGFVKPLYTLDFRQLAYEGEGIEIVKKYIESVPLGLDPQRFSWTVGPWLLPLLVALAQEESDSAKALLNIHSEVELPVIAALTKMGLLEGKNFNDIGKAFYGRTLNAAALVAYLPLFGNIDVLLMGDPKALFERDAAGFERHIDRDLNVRGSGFQHGKFFTEAQALISEIFADEDAPIAVADMGCGDGTWLKSTYANLKDPSIQLIGVDYNEASLRATERNLEGLSPLLIHGDIGDPETLWADLEARGQDPDKVLHIRSFLDHDRPFELPRGASSKIDPRRKLAYLDAGGQELSPDLVQQSLVEHLERWARFAGSRGLVLLEVHSLPPSVAESYADETEAVHFDAWHALSRQYLVEAQDWLLAAVGAGLFPIWSRFRRFPRVLPYTRITLAHYTPRSYKIRHARLSDMDALMGIEEKCWPQSLQTSQTKIEERLTKNPFGHFALIVEDTVVGVLYTQRVHSPDVLKTAQADSVDELYEVDGQWVQFITLNLDPEFQGKSLGDEFIEFALTYVEISPEVKGVCGVTRCRSFGRHSDLSYEAFVELKSESGQYKDPVLAFHRSHGAIIGAPVLQYRPRDEENHGYGVFLHYDFQQRRKFLQNDSPDTKTKTASEDVSIEVLGVIRDLMGDRRARFDPDVPLRELGFDSMDIMELRTQLAQLARRPIESNFFFRHPTPKSIVTALTTPQPNHSQASPEKFLKRKPVEEPVTSDPARAESAISICGMACRFPGGVRSTQDLWELLKSGADVISAVPQTRPVVAGSERQRLGGYLEDVDHFDAGFFKMAPTEVEQTDPQQRILLEETWHALEDAGIAPETLRGSKTGIFIGQFGHDYEQLILKNAPSEEVDTYLGTGNSPAITAGRLAYFLGTEGPALTVDTACSSALTATHLARQSLENRECDVAIVGAVNLLLSDALGTAFDKAGMLAPDGRCKTFDSRANGYVRSEGCAVIVLKREQDALASGDRIHACILATALNQDGASNGLTAPNPKAQENLICEALQVAGLEADDIQMVEAHGTGTSLGDPIEFSALKNTYGKDRASLLYIGSIKTNLGHTESAAGFAGLFKAVLALKHREIPPSLHFESPNPQIDLSDDLFRIPQSSTPWPEETLVTARAAVSSFGFSGTNGHIIVEAPAESEPSRHHGLIQALTFSAAHPKALAQMRLAYLDKLRNTPGDLFDFAASSNLRRAPFNYRIAVSLKDPQNALEVLENAKIQEVDPQSKCAWMFTGQGAQYQGMGRSLYGNCGLYRAHFDSVAAALNPYLDAPVNEVVFEDSSDSRIHQTAFTQPMIFAFQYALGKTLIAWGIRPNYAIGHSVGEYAALCLFGGMNLEDAARLICARGRLMQALPRDGSMLAVNCDLETGERFLEGMHQVSVAAQNARTSLVFSGATVEIEAIEKSVLAEGFKAKRLKVSHAFHSPLMDPMLAEFREVAQSIQFREPEIPVYSTVNVSSNSQQFCDPEYWVRHIRSTVKFAPALDKLMQTKPALCMEIGPRAVLAGLGMRDFADDESTQFVASVEGFGLEAEGLSHCLAKLWELGFAVQWEQVHSDFEYTVCDLPLYPFRKESYWIMAGDMAVGSKPAENNFLTSPLLEQSILEKSISLERFPYLQDHIIQHIAIVPAANHLATWIEAIDGYRRGEAVRPICVSSVLFSQALVLRDRIERKTQLLVQKESEDFQYISFEDDAEHALHASGKVGVALPRPKGPNIQEMKGRLPKVEASIINDAMTRRGFALGNTFIWATEFYKDKTQALCRLRKPDNLKLSKDFRIHPTLVDAIFQPFFALLPGADAQTWVPFSLDTFTLYQTPNDRLATGGDLWCAISLKEQKLGEEYQYSIDTILFDESENVFATAEQLQFRAVPEGTFQALVSSSQDFFKALRWEAVQLPAKVEPAEFAYCSLGEIAENVEGLEFLPFESVEELDSKTLCIYLPETGFESVLDRLPKVVDIYAFCANIDSHVEHLFWIQKTSHQRPLASMALAMGRSISLENPRLKTGLLELESEVKVDLSLLLRAFEDHPSAHFKVSAEGLLKRVLYLENTPEFTSAMVDTRGRILITGGKSGIGLITAETLVELGYTHLLLASRSNLSRENNEAIETLRDSGADIELVNIDICDGAAVQALFDRYQKQDLPITGVIHAAGVLADGVFPAEDRKRFYSPINTKLQGAWNLHNATQSGHPVSFFIQYSSVAALSGSFGQSNYAAANASLEALCEYRQSLGLPGLSVQWGPWEIGMAKGLGDVERDAWRQRGYQFISSESGKEAIKKLLGSRLLHTEVVACHINSVSFEASFPYLATKRSEEDIVSDKKSQTQADAWRALAVVERRGLIYQHLESALIKLLRLREAPDKRARFFDLGMDSITAVRLRNGLNDSIGEKLPSTVIFDYPTLESLQEFIDQRISDSIANVPTEATFPEVEPETTVPEAGDNTLEIESLDESALLEEVTRRAESLNTLLEKLT